MTTSARVETAAPAAAASTFDHWAIVEIFGHQRIAGRVREELVAGKAFLRVDVPATGDGAEAFTRYYGAAAIYSLTPTTEAVVRLAAAQLRAAAVNVYLPPARQLASGGAPDDGLDYDDFEDTQL